MKIKQKQIARHIMLFVSNEISIKRNSGRNIVCVEFKSLSIV